MSELSVGQLKGLPVNSNVITVPAGHMLYPPGHVVQVVSASTVTEVANSSSTAWASTTLTATITPKYASSKIAVIATNNGVGRDPYNASGAAHIKLMRNGSLDLAFAYSMGYSGGGADLRGYSATFNYLDNPATTSAVTYATYIISAASGNNAWTQRSGSGSTMILMEIAA